MIPSFSILTANHTARGLFVPNDFCGFWFSSLLGYSFVFIHLFTTGHSLLPTSASCPQLLYSFSLSHTVLCFSILQRGFLHHCLLSLSLSVYIYLLGLAFDSHWLWGFCYCHVLSSDWFVFSLIAFMSEVNMSFSHYMDDEYEKLFRRMNPPRYQFSLPI